LTLNLQLAADAVTPGEY